MALGGGTFLVQNKVLPGAYINFVSRPRAMGHLGERGVLCMAMALDWGQEGMMSIEAEDFQKNAKDIFGYDYTNDALKRLREAFMGAKTVKLYRLNGGEKAKAMLGALSVAARCSGARGNDLQVAIVGSLDEENVFEIKTYLDYTLVNVQEVTTIADIKDNEFVTFGGSGSLEASAAVTLTGGESAAVAGSGYADFLEAAEAEDFHVLLYDGADVVTKKLFVNFTKRMRDDEGVKFVTVLHDYADADHEGIISVGTAKELVYWVAGMEAGANVNESLTNAAYDGEYDIRVKESKSSFIKRIQKGEFVFYEDGDKIRVLRDVNTFTSFESVKNSDFCSNRVVRVLDSIANDVARIFSQYYLGKQSNNNNGRNLLKAEIIAYHEQLQGIEAIENFAAEDITVSAGAQKQDVVVYEAVQPTDAMEKLYMKVEVV